MRLCCNRIPKQKEYRSHGTWNNLKILAGMAKQVFAALFLLALLAGTHEMHIHLKGELVDTIGASESIDEPGVKLTLPCCIWKVVSDHYAEDKFVDNLRNRSLWMQRLFTFVTWRFHVLAHCASSSSSQINLQCSSVQPSTHAAHSQSFWLTLHSQKYPAVDYGYPEDIRGHACDQACVLKALAASIWPFVVTWLSCRVLHKHQLREKVFGWQAGSLSWSIRWHLHTCIPWCQRPCGIPVAILVECLKPAKSALDCMSRLRHLMKPLVLEIAVPLFWVHLLMNTIPKHSERYKPFLTCLTSVAHFWNKGALCLLQAGQFRCRIFNWT